MTSPIKVSVIVPTFRSGDGLQRVIDSLDGQSMPVDEFEVIFVDDGSGDNTAERLRALAADRPNVHVIEIENSGWGSRPRNVGIDAAIGEYVTFLDHDDSLFPEALRSAYEAGAAIEADFVNPKEVTNRGWSWGWDVWREDRELTSREQMTPKDVTPLIPHKLYRREFLNDHGIRFPEGPRAFWEDFYVNTEVYVHAKRIAILASVPFYKWHRDTGSNSSDKLYENVDEYWQKLGEVARFMVEQVDDPTARRWLLLNHYRWWVVDLFGPHMSRRDPQFIEDSMPHMKGFLERWVPENADADLEAAHAATSWLMHHSDLEHLRALAVVDKSRTAVATSTSVEWTTSGLRVRAQATWCDSDGEPILFRRQGERLIRELPAELAAVFPVDVLDVRDAVAGAWAGLSLRSRGDRVSWRLPTEFDVHLDDRGPELVSVRLTAEAVIDPSHAAVGGALADGVWEVGARFGFMGVETHAGVRYAEAQLPAIWQGRVVVGYATGRGVLAFDLGGASRQLVTPSRLDLASVTSSGGELQVRLAGVTVVGERLPLTVAVDSTTVDARINPDGVLVVPIPAARGRHEWNTVIAGVASKPLPPMIVGRWGRVKLASD